MRIDAPAGKNAVRALILFVADPEQRMQLDRLNSVLPDSQAIRRGLRVERVPDQDIDDTVFRPNLDRRSNTRGNHSYRPPARATDPLANQLDRAEHGRYDQGDDGCRTEREEGQRARSRSPDAGAVAQPAIPVERHHAGED
jgi:hypothetical protein